MLRSTNIDMLRWTAYFNKFAGMGSTEDPMQIDRLIQIIFLLLSHESITAKALAEEFGVSTRTIYRDINILSVAGIPITSQKGYGGGLSLLEGFSLDKSYFTRAEQSNIIKALQILKSSKIGRAHV